MLPQQQSIDHQNCYNLKELKIHEQFNTDLFKFNSVKISKLQLNFLKTVSSHIKSMIKVFKSSNLKKLIIYIKTFFTYIQDFFNLCEGLLAFYY